jgi:hypothetical protein
MPQLPFELLSPEERAAARDKQRRALAALPGSSIEAAFLAAEARRLADVLYRLEDSLLALVGKLFVFALFRFIFLFPLFVSAMLLSFVFNFELGF